MPEPEDLILFPWGGNSREALAVAEAMNRERRVWNIIGFLHDDPVCKGIRFMDYEVLGGKEQLKKYPHAKVVAVAGTPETYVRRDAFITALQLPDDRFATLTHPDACIGVGVVIGFNTVIMAGVAATVNVRIGNHCFILPNTVISHDSVIGDYTMIGSNVSISGHVQVEEQCYIGSGARIMQDVVLGRKTLAGMGAVILKTTEPGSVAVGNPGRVIRKVDACYL